MEVMSLRGLRKFLEKEYGVALNTAARHSDRACGRKVLTRIAIKYGYHPSVIAKELNCDRTTVLIQDRDFDRVRMIDLDAYNKALNHFSLPFLRIYKQIHIDGDHPVLADMREGLSKLSLRQLKDFEKNYYNEYFATKED